MNTILASIVTPNGKVYEGEVHMVSVRAVAGDMGILPNHIPVVAPLKISAVKFKVYGEEEFVAVNGGFIEVRHDSVTILTEAAELQGEIDVKRAEHSKEEAERRLSELSESSPEYNEVQNEFKRAENRLEVASKHF